MTAIHGTPSDGPSTGPDELVGQLVGQYRITRLLGRGGMGEVYLARDTQLGRKVAIKVVRSEVLSNDASRERFLVEARLTACFAHPHIVTVYGAGEHAGRPYVVLEYLDGGTLRERLQAGRLLAPEAMRLGLAIAQALVEAHEHGILHRDLKPENVVIPHDGRLRVVDFGLAKTLAPDVSLLETGTINETLDSMVSPQGMQSTGGRIAGTPQYMAPEQWRSEPSSSATDIWALGIMLREMLGSHPFADEKGVLGLYAAVTAPEPVPPLTSAVTCPAELARLITQCTQKDPAARLSAREVVETLQRLCNPGRVSVDDAIGPFRGLLAFTEQQAGSFFGRSGEIDAFMERLREEPVLPVVGPSGAGKSSFIHAGVLPRLREQGPWSVLSLRPGSDPFRALASRLVLGDRASAPLSLSSLSASHRSLMADETHELATVLRASPGRLALRLQRLAESEQAGVLLVVDQLEELETLVESVEERASFLTAIATAADDPEIPIRVVLTLRDDFLGRLAEVPAAARVLHHVTVLTSPGPDALADTLRLPLESTSVRWENEALVDEMVAAVRGETAALPLLQFTAQALWERRDRQAGMLTWQAYRTLGGVEGALASQADQVLEALTAQQRRTTRQLFLRLVTSEGTRRVQPRSQLLAGMDEDAPTVLERWAQNRTVVIHRSRGQDQDPEVELVHEALISAWGQLRRWLEENREELVALEEVSQAAEVWSRRGAPKDEVWMGTPLSDALRRLEPIEGDLPQAVRAFLDAGRARERRRSRVRRVTMAASFIVLALIAAGAIAISATLSASNKEIEERRVEVQAQRDEAQSQRQEAQLQRSQADAQRAEAEERRAEALLDSSQRAWESGDVLSARAQLRKSLELLDRPAGRLLWQDMQHTPIWRRITQKCVKPDAFRAFFADKHGDLIVTLCDGVLSVQSSLTGEVIGSPEVKAVQTAEGSPESGRLALVDGEGTLRLFDSSTFEPTATLPAARKGAWTIDLALEPSGARVVMVYNDGEVELWDVRRAAKVCSTTITDASRAVFQPGSQAVAVGSAGRVQMLDGASCATRWTTEVKSFNGFSFSGNGQRLAIAALRPEITVLDAESGAPLQSLHGQRPHVGVAFGEHDLLFSVGAERTLTRWDLSTGKRTNAPVTFFSLPRHVDVSCDGGWVLGGSAEELVLLRSGFEEAPRPPMVPHTNAVTVVALSADGALAATGALDGTVAVWETKTGQQRWSLPRQTNWISGVAFGEDDKVLHTTSVNFQMRTWEVKSGRVVHEITVATHAAGALVRGAHELQVASLNYGTETGVALNRISMDGSQVLGSLSTEARDGVRHRYSADATALAVTTQDGSLYVLDAVSGRTLWRREGEGQNIVALNWAPDGTQLVTLDQLGVLTLFDGVTGQLQASRATPELGRELVLLPDGRVLVAADTLVAFDVATSEPGIAVPTFEPLAGFTFNADVTQLFAVGTRSGVLYRFSVPTLRPAWTLGATLKHSRLVQTQAGWTALQPGLPLVPAASSRSAWLHAVETQSNRSDESETLGCLATAEGTIELWDLALDKPVNTYSGMGAAEVRALGQACFVGDGARKGLMLGRQGDARAVAEEYWEASVDGDKLLLITHSDLLVFGSDGQLEATIPTHGVTFAATGAQGRLLLAGKKGALEWLDLNTQERSSFTLLDAPPDTPSVMVLGPAGTLVIGYESGVVGVWSLESHQLLQKTQLRGLILDLSVFDEIVYASSSVGELRAIDLRVLAQLRCDVLREAWETIPVSWVGSRAVLAQPPVDHPCATAPEPMPHDEAP